MRLFKDRHARDWSLEITVATANRVRAAADVNLFGLLENRFAGLFALLGDPFRFVPVLFVLCREQARKTFPDAATDEALADAFADSLAGDALEGATEAFTEAYLDFFPNRAARPAARKALAKSRELGSLMAARAEAEIDAATAGQMLEQLNSPSGNTPASSASTPEPSPPASSP